MATDQARLLVRVATDPGLRDWLTAQMVEAHRVLGEATEPVTIYRAQGQLSLAIRLQKMLSAASDLR